MATSQREYQAMLLDILPRQGGWGASEYIWLTDRARRLIEYDDGEIEVLPMPTEIHQAILTLLMRALLQYLDPRGGVIRFAPLRLRLSVDKYREPDLLVLLDHDDPRRAPRYWLGADWVLEVVSPDDPGVLDRQPARPDGDGADPAIGGWCLQRARRLQGRRDRHLGAASWLRGHGG